MVIYATNEDFDSAVAEGFAIVDFYSTTCVPCKLFSRILEDMSLEFPFLNIVKVNTTDYKELGSRFNVQAVPTAVFMKDGKEVYRHVGVMNDEELKEVISKHLYS